MSTTDESAPTLASLKHEIAVLERQVKAARRAASITKVSRHLQERPLTVALAAFGAGLIGGLMLRPPLSAQTRHVTALARDYGPYLPALKRLAGR